MRKWIAGLLLIAVAVLALAIPKPGRAQDDVQAEAIIARLNAWRMSEDVWPLKPNDTLEALALEQAHFITSLPELPDDLHIDSRGLNPRERALLTPYSWPHYQLPTQIAIGENAALGDVEYALEFWHESDTHKKTALNPAYREVGVAAVPYRNSTLFIAVFGARPDVLPALVDPRDGRTLYLSNERFEYAHFNDSVQTVKTIQVFDSAGRPLYDEPVAWTDRLAVPADAGNSVFILSTDGEHEVISPVDLTRDQVLLPDKLAPAIEPTATTTTITEATAVPTESVPAEATPEATVTPVTQADLLIVYSADTLDVLNVSGAEADWRTLEFDGTINYPFTQWTKVTVFPLEALPNRHCLQLRSQAVSGDVVKLDDCGWVRSLIQVDPSRVFWQQGPFDVKRNGITIATCQPDASVCAVDLP